MSEVHQNGNLLEVRGLRTQFFTEAGVVRAVDGVDFEVRRGEVLGLVGESGCGKSVTSLSVMKLVSRPGEIVEGEILFDDEDLVRKRESEMLDVRGNRISMIFQQPTSCLNPVFRVGDQLAEVLIIHEGLSKAESKKRAVELLEMVGIPEPESRVNAYPHELSGGMAQRVMIAMALACVPELLIADEPTTALDVTIQAQILDLLLDLQKETGMALVLITHDMGVVAETAERVQVQYAGQKVEERPVADLFDTPHHPYAAALLAALPERATGDRLPTIPGVVPGQFDRPAGCLFSPRCAYADDRCRAVRPPPLPSLGQARCHYPLNAGPEREAIVAREGAR